MAAGHEIALVVSQPDRPVGRAQQLTAPPVKQAALAAGLPVTQPEKIRNNAEFRAQLEAIAPGRDRGCGLWAHHSAVDAGVAAAGLHQSAWFAAAKVSRRRADSVGRGDGRRVDGQHDNAAGRRPGYRADSAAADALQLGRSRPRRICLTMLAEAARRWWWRRWPGWPRERFSRSRRITRGPRLLRC